MIKYPRRCEHCNYLSNNPTMYHYHKKTHQLIPDGTLCDHGCNHQALFIGTGGKYTCRKNAHQCEAYIEKHATRIKSHWARPEAIQRKEITKQSFIERLHNKETVEKIKKTKKAKYNTLSIDDIKEFRVYARIARKGAQQWAKQQGYILGQQTYHVDHKLSLKDAWVAKLPIYIVNHPINLQVIEAKQNSSKGSKSIITVEELLNITREIS